MADGGDTMESDDFHMRSNKLYDCLVEFLTEKLGELSVHGPQKFLEAQLVPNNEQSEIRSKGEVWLRLLGSSANKQDKANVIGDVALMAQALDQFDSDRFAARFLGESLNTDLLRKHFGKFDIVAIRPDTRWTKKSHWPQFLKTCLSSARFLQRFQDHKAFFVWADKYYQDEETRIALPLVLSEEIHGLGYALACDFLKEIGYTDFGKPDVHTKEILTKLGFCALNSTNFAVQNEIVAIAKAISETNGKSVSPYAVDKLLWLVGSGKFYKNGTSGVEMKIGRNKNDFISRFSDQFVDRTRSDVS